MLDKIVCHNESCRKIPSLIIDQNTPTVKIYCPEHKERILRIKDYINACEQGNNLRCSNCGKRRLWIILYFIAISVKNI